MADDSGRTILAMLQKAADMAKEDCARAMDLAHKLSFQLRAAENARENSKRRRPIFATAPPARKHGCCASIRKLNRRSFKRRTESRGNRHASEGPGADE